MFAGMRMCTFRKKSVISNTYDEATQSCSVRSTGSIWEQYNFILLNQELRFTGQLLVIGIPRFKMDPQASVCGWMASQHQTFLYRVLMTYTEKT